MSVCHFPPYTYVTAGRRGVLVYGPWVHSFLQAVGNGSDRADVTWSVTACGVGPMLASLRSGAADAALHPMLVGQECGGCTWSYPMQMSGMMFVSGAPHAALDALAPFSSTSWALIMSVLVGFALTAAALDRQPRHLFYVLLTVTSNLQYPDTTVTAVHVLYAGLAVFSTLMSSIYVSDLTANVLREKSVTATRMKDLMKAGSSFNVMEGGALQQMQAQYPDARYNVVPYDVAVASVPSLVPWEVGEMIKESACVPISAETGIAARLPYGIAFAPALPEATVAAVNARIRDVVLSDEMQYDTLRWIGLKYECGDSGAPRLTSATMMPMAHVGMWVCVSVVGATLVRAYINRFRRAKPTEGR